MADLEAHDAGLIDPEIEEHEAAGAVGDEDECITCSEVNATPGGIPGIENGECAHSQRACGHHCNCSWIHDCCHWCKAEFGEEGVVTFPKDSERVQ